jgi:hypothetical protein
MERLYALGELSLDVLLTHDVPRHGIEPHPGTEEIRLMLDAYTPACHFYGHADDPFQEHLDRNGVT